MNTEDSCISDWKDREMLQLLAYISFDSAMEESTIDLIQHHSNPLDRSIQIFSGRHQQRR